MVRKYIDEINTKVISQLKVNKEVHKKLHIIAIQQEISLSALCIEILSKFVSGKKGVDLENKEI